jgi:hypothetical protein
MFVDTPAHNSDRVVRGVPSDLVSLSSINTAGAAASVMGMFNTSALYNDALLDNNVYGGGNSSGGGGGSSKSSALNYSGTVSSMLLPPGAGSAGAGAVGGRTGAAAGGGGGRSSYAFDTASVKSQDDTIRYKPVLHFRLHLYFSFCKCVLPSNFVPRLVCH